MADTVVKKAVLKITADDGDTEAKLASIRAKAEELGRLHPEIKVRIDKAAATAQMAVLRGDLKRGADQLAADASNAGNQAGQGFFSRFGSWLKPSKFQLITSAVSLGLAALPAAVAGAGAAAGIALGAAILIGSKKSKGPLYDSFHDTMSGLVSMVRRDAMPLAAPVKHAFTQLGGFLRSLSPEVKAVFSALGPAVMPLTRGIESLVAGLLPGFLALLRAAHPAVAALASLLGNLGGDLGSMFRSFSTAIGPSSLILKGLGEILNGLLPVIGGLAATLARALGPAFAALGGAVKALSPALGAIGRILGSLASAVLRSLAGALSAVASLAKAAAPSFAVLAAALSKTFTLMENSGSFGVLESSLEKMAVPLGRLVNALVTGLAPVLSALIGTISQVSASVTGHLAAAIISLLPSVTLLATQLAHMLVQLTPLFPSVVKLAGALLGLLPALTPLIPPTIEMIAELVQLATRAMPPVVTMAGHVVNAITDVVKVVVTVIRWIAGVISAVYRWEAGLGRMVSSARSTAAGIGRAWDSIVSGVEHMVGAVISWFEGLAGKVRGAVADFPSALMGAGEALIQGLINGVKSMLGAALSAVESVGSKIVDTAKRFLGISSPSRVFAQIGQMLVQGLALGLGRSAAATSAAKQLAREVTAALSSGQFGGRETAVTAFIRQDTGALRFLAAARNRVLHQIAAARQFAGSVTTSAEQFAGLGNIVSGLPQGARVTGTALESGLRIDLSKIWRFNAAIRRLANEGLDKALLQQIISAGPDQGLQIAEALLSGPMSQIRSLNRTEGAIGRASRALGSTAADEMYKTGRYAGKGFLDGLEAERTAITRMMERIARDMVRTLKRELGISSPSRVGHYHGQMFGEGIAAGIDASRVKAVAAAQRLARSVAVAGAPRGAVLAGAGFGAAGTVRVEIDLRGGDDEFMTWLKRQIRIRGGNPEVVGR